MHWLLHLLGVDNVSGRWYGFWSGFGSDIGEVAILGGAYSLLRKHNCHAGHCWRIGRHLVDGTPWCNHHHAGARDAHAATQPPQPHAETHKRLAKLSEDVSGLAEAVRAAVTTRKAGQ